MGMNPERESAAAVAVYGDLLAEILVRLPAKSLTRSKLVCKHWLSVISGDEFRRRYTLHGPKPPASLLLQTRTSKFFHIKPFDKKPILVPYKFRLPNPKIKILSSCNGLMLLESESHLRTDYYVHNPTTNQSRRIVLDYCEDYPGIVGLSLAFDPSKSLHYTIVLVRGALKSPDYNDRRQRIFRVEVYDSESCIWEKGSEPFTASAELKFSSGVHCNGLIYWKSSWYYYDIGKKTLRFSDLAWCDELDGDGDGVCVFGSTSSLVLDRSGKIKGCSFGDDESMKELVDLRDQPFYNNRDYVDFASHNVHLFQETLAPI
ncbi:hypothetical protein C2S51_025353 [Perilla frutescens var. frutescens]|nr:hypothetical protein C2S51_025353 [Perilla frutescens var. frutescens]